MKNLRSDKKIQDIKNVYQKFGLKNALKNIIYKEKEEVVLIKDLRERIKLSFDKLQVVPIEKRHWDGVIKFTRENHHYSNAWIRVRSYIRNGYNGFVAQLDGSIIGYIWWVDNKINATKNHPELIRYDIKLNDDVAYTTDLFIAPAFRGKAHAMEFFNRVFLELNKLGYNWVLGAVDIDNVAAKWTYTVLGFKERNRLTSRRFLSFFVVVNNSIFMKSSRWNHTHPLDFRLLYSFRKA